MIDPDDSEAEEKYYKDFIAPASDDEKSE